MITIGPFRGLKLVLVLNSAFLLSLCTFGGTLQFCGLTGGFHQTSGWVRVLGSILEGSGPDWIKRGRDEGANSK